MKNKKTYTPHEKKTKQENVTTLAVLRSRVRLRSVWQYHTSVLRRERCWRILKPPASWFVLVRAAAEAQTSEKSMSPEARVLTYQRLTSDPCFGVSPSFSNAFLLPNLFQKMKKKSANSSWVEGDLRVTLAGVSVKLMEAPVTPHSLIIQSAKAQRTK